MLPSVTCSHMGPPLLQTCHSLSSAMTQSACALPHAVPTLIWPSCQQQDHWGLWTSGPSPSNSLGTLARGSLGFGHLLGSRVGGGAVLGLMGLGGVHLGHQDRGWQQPESGGAPLPPIVRGRVETGSGDGPGFWRRQSCV